MTLAGDFGEVHLLADVRIQGRPARTVFASPKQLTVIVPSGLSDGGFSSISLNEVSSEHGLLEVGVPIATGLHQVDNPLIDRAGNVYLTYSGTRGQQVPVSIFRVAPSGARETYSSSVVNPTSMAMDAEGRLYVSSRFEGTVYRLAGRWSRLNSCPKAVAPCFDFGTAASRPRRRRRSRQRSTGRDGRNT